MLLTERKVKAAKAGPKDFFLRDDQVKGFGLKVTPKGRKSFIAEGRIKGAGTKRITIGTHPTLSVQQARTEATKVLAEMQLGIDPKAKLEAAKHASRNLFEVFEEYMEGKDRKLRTEKDYFVPLAEFEHRPLGFLPKWMIDFGRVNTEQSYLRFVDDDCIAIRHPCFSLQNFACWQMLRSFGFGPVRLSS